MDTNLATGLAVLAAPSLFGVAIYFFHDYKETNDDRITRLEGILMSAKRETKELSAQYSTVKHEIEIVMKDDTRSLVVVELNKMKKELDILLDKDRMEMSDIKNLQYFSSRHEEGLAKVHQILKTNYTKIQDLYMRVNNLDLKG